MEITDFHTQLQVHNIKELQSALCVRYRANQNSVNMFWLAHEEEYPQLGIQVNGHLAALHFFPGDGSAGYRSLGPAIGLDPNGVTLFWISEIDAPDEHPNCFVVETEIAEAAAKEFLQSRVLPTNLRWLNL
jgi:hypothetical protein